MDVNEDNVALSALSEDSVEDGGSVRLNCGKTEASGLDPEAVHASKPTRQAVHNFGHTYTVPLALGAYGFWIDARLALLVASIWGAQIGLDRLVGIALCTENLHQEDKQNMSLPLATIVDHIDYVVDRVGIDHVAIGSDFDGATVPEAIGDVTGLPLLFEALDARGYDESDRRAIAHENWLRVVETTW